MLSHIAMETKIADDMDVLYSNATTIFECDNLFKEFGDTIRMHTTSDEDDMSPQEFNYAVAMNLHNANSKYNETRVQQIREAQDLTASHKPNKVKASNKTTTTQEPAMNTFAQEIAMNIESMNLSQLAELQVAIAARMQELINKPAAVEVVAPIEPVVEAKPVAKGAARVKRTTQPAPKVEASRNAEVAAAVAKNDEIVRNQILAKKEEAAKAESPLAASTSDVSTMKYADLRSYISAATKSNPRAKEIATKVAANRGQKSWATVGRDGYETIYNQIQIINLK